MKKISLLGSTGFIGRAVLEIVKQFPGRYEIVGITAGNNIELLESQINTFKPKVAAVSDEFAAGELRKKNISIDILSGQRGISEVAALGDADMVVCAIVGSASLMPTFAAVRAGKDIALASKEALVMAGSIIMSEASKNGIAVIPVDSEHSAIFQCLNGRPRDEVRKIILTASGGPFLGKSMAELQSVTPEAALRHPNWQMGKKITIDSATLMNKGLEVIEAYWLFGMPVEKIKILLHPQSIVHSMVEFIDGSILAQLSVPDMKGPISYALSYPERTEDVVPSLDFSKVRELTFEEPDFAQYKCLSLIYDALSTGGTMPSVLNTANEIAVDAFLQRKITFAEIPEIVSLTMTKHKVSAGGTIEDVMHASDWARETALDFIQSKKIKVNQGIKK